MRRRRLVIGVALALLTCAAAGCADKGNRGAVNLNGMTKAQQESAMKGDPSKIPADIKAKYIDKPIVAPVVSPSAAVAAAQGKTNKP